MALKSSEESADLALPEVSLATKKILGVSRMSKNIKTDSNSLSHAAENTPLK